MHLLHLLNQGISYHRFFSDFPQIQPSFIAQTLLHHIIIASDRPLVFCFVELGAHKYLSFLS
jgi:hypothetical protein